MPDFYVDEISIDPDEFVSACNSKDLNELIDELVDRGLVTRKAVQTEARGNDEQLYEEALLKLGGKWNMLTHAESEFISNLAKRF